MSSEDSYAFDVAFSFLARDIGIANQLADALADRYKCFVFSRHQEEIAGTDGQETFSTVFGKAAQCVVVIYRDGWGETPWTRVEQHAIQDRALDEGWDFLLFISVDAKQSVPKWLPRSRLWLDLERYGASGAVGASASHVQRAGVAPKAESLADKAKRTRRELDYQARRQEFSRGRGALAASSEVGNLFSALETQCKAISGVAALTLKIANQRSAFVLDAPCSASVRWRQPYSNALTEAQLEVGFWNGRPEIPGEYRISGFGFREPTMYSSLLFALDIGPSNELTWRPLNGDQSQLFGSETLAEFILGRLLDEIRKQAK